jgi:hypothetical protein
MLPELKLVFSCFRLARSNVGRRGKRAQLSSLVADWSGIPFEVLADK